MELNVSPPEKGMLHWHATNLLWWNLVSLHLPKREQIALVASRPGRGYSAASQSLFRRPLFALSADEAATVVALAFAPNYYRAHPERLAQRRDFLLSKLQSSPSPKE
jgi:hypothetical protein